MAKTEKNNAVILLVSTTILILLGVAFLSSLSDQTLVNTQRTPVSQERHLLLNPVIGDINTTAVYTVNYPPTGWKQEDCMLESFSISNYSGTLTLTKDTDYTVNLNNGTYSLLNTSATVKLVGAV